MPCPAMSGEPNACAASSISGSPSSASSTSGAGRPNRWTGMIAFVRAVTRRATSSGSRFIVAASTSAKTGVAPTRAIDSGVAKNVKAGQITSSPGPMPSPSSTSTSASVPLPQPTVSGTPRYSAASSSNAFVVGLKTRAPLSRPSAKAAFSSGISGAYCAFTSTSGTLDTALDGSRAALSPPGEEEDEENRDPERDRVVDETEVLVERVPARAERPACTGEREAPGERARNGQERVLALAHPRDPGRDGDEGADDRRDPAEEHRAVAVPLEPPIGLVEVLRGQ